jgi:hypothetical protein
VSILVEAAFQHHVWAPRLKEMEKVARLKLLICDIDPSLALERRRKRLLADPNREKFHGETGQGALGNKDMRQGYDPPALNIPTLQVNTTNEYDPDLEAILGFIQQDRKR